MAAAVATVTPVAASWPTTFMAPTAIAIASAAFASAFATASARFGSHGYVHAVEVRLFFGRELGAAFYYRRWRGLRRTLRGFRRALGFRRRSLARHLGSLLL